MAEKELQKRLNKYFTEIAKYDEISIEEAKEYVRKSWGEYGLRGYGIFDSNDVDYAHIEKIDEMDIYDDDLEASKVAERDGIKIIHDLYFDEETFGQPHIAYNGTIVDTPENRKIVVKLFEKEGITV